MKKTLSLIVGLIALPLSAAAATTFSVDLTPKTAGTTGISAPGISSTNVWGYTLQDGVSAWHGTWELNALNGQVGFNATDGTISLQLGGSASVGHGNYAGVKFELPEAPATATLSFDIAKTSAWGGANFNCTYHANIYGYSETGVATIIGTWSLENAKTGTTLNEIIHVDIDLDLTGGDYASYGLVFDALKVGDSGGIGMTISNIEVTGELNVPEPATVSLSLLGLSALLLRRRKA